MSIKLVVSISTLLLSIGVNSAELFVVFKGVYPGGAL